MLAKVDHYSTNENIGRKDDANDDIVCHQHLSYHAFNYYHVLPQIRLAVLDFTVGPL